MKGAGNIKGISSLKELVQNSDNHQSQSLRWDLKGRLCSILGLGRKAIIIRTSLPGQENTIPGLWKKIFPIHNRNKVLRGRCCALK